MKKKITENKYHMFSPTISFISSHETHSHQNKVAFNRSKTPFFRKKSNFNSFSSEDENISTNTLNKSINNQTFIYNSINFNNQGLFNNINNTNNNHKRRKSGGTNNYIVNNGILNFFETMKKSRSISKQKKSKYITIINKLNNTPLFCKTINKHKTKYYSKQKNNSFKNEKKKINTLINCNHINNSPSYLNNTNNFNRKNKRKLLTTNYNINKNINMINSLNNNKINNLMVNNSKTKKVKKTNDIFNKSVNLKINTITNFKNIPTGDSDRNNNIQSSEEYNTITEEEKNILVKIESLIFQLLNNSSSPKKNIIKEIENIYRNAIEWCNNNEGTQNYINTETDILCRKKSNSNLNLSKKNSKKNLETESKKLNNNNISNTNNKLGEKNKELIEKELNILNKKYNQIKEENINLKYLITEKTTAFEDVKNSLKNFQNEINQLKNNNTNNNNNQNTLKNKTNENNNIDDNNDKNNVIINSKGLEIKNIKLNLSNVQRVDEIQDLSSDKSKQKESNRQNNSFNCNNYSFGQNNSFEINFENSKNSKKDILNSNRSIDPLSLTFHDNIDDLQQNEIEQELSLKNYDFSPSLRKATEILIQTGTMPNKNEKK